jgi:hypothetical protein
MLVETKDLTPFTFGFIGEGFQNENKNLETILFTLVQLSTFGYSYFKGNFADRGRYESLVCPFFIFLQMIATKLREFFYPQSADRLLENKKESIQFLKQNKWTRNDMAGQEWFNNYGWIYYGKIKGLKLFESKGVCMY